LPKIGGAELLQRRDRGLGALLRGLGLVRHTLDALLELADLIGSMAGTGEDAAARKRDQQRRRCAKRT
jgi:hypothetical protein